MSYNSIATFRLTAYPSGSFSSIPDEVIQSDLNYAYSAINSALRVHHTLPMNTGSFEIELGQIYDAERTIAAYRLMTYVGFKPNIQGSTDEVLQNRYAEVMDPTDGFLAQLRNGKILFPQGADSTPTISEGRPKVYGSTIISDGIRTIDGVRVV